MDEEADLALLDQHLLKTNALSQRMTSILAQLDARLSRLDKSVAPLGLQPLTRKAANIDAVLLSLSPEGGLPARTAIPPRLAPASHTVSAESSTDSTVKGYSLEPPLTPIASTAGTRTGTPADETTLLTRGPDIMALGEYFSAMDAVISDLERMWKGFNEGRGGAREAGVRDLSKLVEVGFGGLVQLFLQLSHDGSSKLFDPQHLLSSGAPTPPTYFAPLNTVLPLSTRIDKLLGPSEPTPKTGSIIMPMFDDAMEEFAVTRGDWMTRSLRSMLVRIEEVDEGGIWESSRGREKVRGLVDLWEVLLVVIEAETLLLTTLFPTRAPSAALPHSMMQPFNAVVAALQPTLNTIKRSLSSHTFVALDLYQSFAQLQSRWDAVLDKCFSMTRVDTSSADSRELLGALNVQLNTLRGLALRSFPELLVDIRTAPTKQGSTSAISDSTHSTLTYLETLPTYEKTVESLLARSQSERSWLMGQKEAPSPAINANEEGGIVNLYVADVLGTLLIFLQAQARAMKRPIGQAFLLNNLSHIRNTTSSFRSDIIGPGAEDMLNKAFRDAKAQYLSEWNALVGSLTSVHTPRFGANPLGSSERSNLKEGLTAFFERLAELERTCIEFPLNRQDPDMRDRVAKEVEEIVVGGYRPFYTKCHGKGLEKSVGGGSEAIANRRAYLLTHSSTLNVCGHGVAGIRHVDQLVGCLEPGDDIVTLPGLKTAQCQQATTIGDFPRIAVGGGGRRFRDVAVSGYANQQA